jgi:hypothetical protein
LEALSASYPKRQPTRVTSEAAQTMWLARVVTFSGRGLKRLGKRVEWPTGGANRRTTVANSIPIDEKRLRLAVGRLILRVCRFASQLGH